MGQGAFSNTKQGFALGRSTVRTGIGVGIGIGIEIGSAGQTFDNDPDPDPDLGRARPVLFCKNLTHLHRCWLLKDI